MNNRSGQLQRLVSVQISLFQQDSKVLEDRRECSWDSRELLERLDRLLSPEHASRGVGSDLGGVTVLAVREVRVVLLLDDMVGSW